MLGGFINPHCLANIASGQKSLTSASPVGTLGGCHVATIDLRGRGECAIAYPQRDRFYFPIRITNEAYLTWFTLMLGKPLIVGQMYDQRSGQRRDPRRVDPRPALTMNVEPRVELV